LLALLNLTLYFLDVGALICIPVDASSDVGAFAPPPSLHRLLYLLSVAGRCIDGSVDAFICPSCAFFWCALSWRWIGLSFGALICLSIGALLCLSIVAVVSLLSRSFPRVLSWRLLSCSLLLSFSFGALIAFSVGALISLSIGSPALR
jgi:hypothetical protein